MDLQLLTGADVAWVPAMAKRKAIGYSDLRIVSPVRPPAWRNLSLRLPDFFIIGAAKAGTTSLYAILDRHPQIFMPEVKEPEFFARDDLYARGLEGYAAAFADARPDQLVGEASTLYTLSPLFPESAARIRAHVPDAKLIYVMREPVSRAYSFYGQLIKNYQNITRDYTVHRTFEAFVLPDRRGAGAPRDNVLSRANAHLPDVPELCLAGSDYVAQIEAYLEHFDRSQMLFLKFEDFVADQLTTLGRITDFLGVDPIDPAILADRSSTRNVSADHFDEIGVVRAIGRLREGAGPLWWLRRLLPARLRARLRSAAAGTAGDAGHELPPMEPATRALLCGRYHAQLPRLAELTALDFSSWDRQG